MKTALNLPQELITSIDLMNTLNGGTSEPMVKLKQFPSHRQITIHIAGVPLENVKMEINKNKLMIYYFTTIVSQGKEVQFPRVLYHKDIPYFVQAGNISAKEEGASVILNLPFNDLANGDPREVPIVK